jgi:HAD superfamily hydrolase (TIGR01509 family)
VTPRPRLVIFDCDGVLVDSELISNAVLARTLTAAGLPTSTEQALRTYQGLMLDDIVGRAQGIHGRRLPPGFLKEFQRARAVEFETSLAPVPGAEDAVRAIKAAGIGVCVASQGQRVKTELTLGLTGLRALFEDGALFSAYDVPRGKPHPDLFLHAAAVMGAAPHETVVVEDSASGVQAASAAEMRVLGYAPGGDGAALRGAGAEVVRAMDEVPARVGVG